jgi:hypothetical protein
VGFLLFKVHLLVCFVALGVLPDAEMLISRFPVFPQFHMFLPALFRYAQYVKNDQHKKIQKHP